MTAADSLANRDREPSPAEFAFDGRPTVETCLEELPAVDFFLGAHVDSGWIKEKLATEFNDEVVQNLKKAVYAVGQGGRRWFSGGDLSSRQASVVLDYCVLIELLLTSRGDLALYRDDLVDCREQLEMQISRCTEGQPQRVAELTRFWQAASGVKSPRRRSGCA